MTLIKVKSRGTDNVSGRRNIAINGAMQVAQRGTITGIGSSNATVYTACDRFNIYTTSSAGRLTASQEAVTDLAGFPNALKLQCTTADTSVAAGELFLLGQRFEGQDVQGIQKGFSTAKEVTVSFYAKANESRVHVLEYYDVDNNRQCSKAFTVTTSWQRFSLTFPADTTGKHDDDINTSINLLWHLHSGSDLTSGTLNTSAFAAANAPNRAAGIGSIVASTNNNFFITGVQVEIGDSASDFEHRSFNEELDLCHRYFFKPITQNTYSPFPIVFNRTVSTGSNGYFAFNIPLPKPMRTIPTFTHNLSNSNHAGSGVAAAAGNWQFYWQNQGWGSFAGSGNMNTINRAMSGDSCVHLGNYYITPSAVQFDQLAIGKDLTLEFSAEL